MTATVDSATGSRRPLSPSLQIYRMRLNAISSIFHRVTGVALYFSLLLVLWMASFYLLGGYEGSLFSALMRIMSGPVGKSFFVLFCSMLAFHGVNGLKYMLMDIFAGRLFDRRVSSRATRLVWICAALCCVMIIFGVVL